MKLIILAAQLYSTFGLLHSAHAHGIEIAPDTFCRRLNKTDRVLMYRVKRTGFHLFGFVWVFRTNFAMLRNMQALHSTGTKGGGDLNT